MFWAAFLCRADKTWCILCKQPHPRSAVLVVLFSFVVQNFIVSVPFGYILLLQFREEQRLLPLLAANARCCAPCWWGRFTGWSSGFWLWQRSIPAPGHCWSTTEGCCRYLFWRRCCSSSWCRLTPVLVGLSRHGKIQSAVSSLAGVKMEWECSLPGAFYASGRTVDYQLNAVPSVAPPCRNREYSDVLQQAVNTLAYCRAKTGSVRVASMHDLCKHRYPPWSLWWNFYSRMAMVSIRHSWTISVASQKLAGSSRHFFIQDHRQQKLNMFNFFLARPDGHRYSQTLCWLLYSAYGIIPDGARPAIRDHLASHPGMFGRGITPHYRLTKSI